MSQCHLDLDLGESVSVDFHVAKSPKARRIASAIASTSLLTAPTYSVAHEHRAGYSEPATTASTAASRSIGV
ncbi:hypothetical protein ABDK96_11690 [Citricoccus nitrophenolicus]|uniref:Uncharacterized protein n=1 Tax=Citricoccus nitrophenolicus TaxID=863575 RepID=A0ABV0IJT9_9MICC